MKTYCPACGCTSQPGWSSLDGTIYGICDDWECAYSFLLATCPNPDIGPHAHIMGAESVMCTP